MIVRTYPVTFLHDHTERRCDDGWHQLIYATRGQLEVITDDMRRIVPADRAVWIPAGTQHTDVMRAPISMRSLFIARGAVRGASRVVRSIAVTPLLRELVLHVSRIGALDRAVPAQARLVGVLLDLLAAAEDVRLELPAPRDPRARKLAELVASTPGDPRSIAELARVCGASLRTLERCFVVETGIALGEWRRRVRLFHALRRVEAGAAVTEVAFEVGYRSVSAFSYAFSRQFGHSPTQRGARR
ncbi:MAG TPA: helix-turn-helix transcriptional regulator [Kofleriaceae bacterium]|nr:helix-turn-helix transcriptional regulator [Kofleriaceae bacterium]